MYQSLYMQVIFSLNILQKQVIRSRILVTLNIL